MRERVLIATALILTAATSSNAQTSPDSTITLSTAVERALREGLDARSARHALDAARHRDRAFGARLMPRLQLTGDAANLDRGINEITQPDGQTSFVRRSRNVTWFEFGVVQPVPWTGGELTVGSRLTRVDQFGDDLDTRLWQTTPLVIGFRQGLFQPRTLEWDRREQDLAIDVAERQYLEARETIAMETAVAYFDLYAAQVSLGNAQANATVNDTLYTLNQGRYQVGKIGENDLLQSELALLRARASLDGARLERDRAAAALRRLLRLPSDAPIAAAAPDVVPAFEIDTTAAIAHALRNASALPEADLQVMRTRRQVSTARAQAGFRADIEASVGFDQTAEAFSSAYESPLAKQQLRLQVQMPLIQWGGGRAAVSAARAEEARATSTAEGRRELVEEEARFTALELTQAQRQLAIAAKADTVAAKRFEVAKNRYIIGKIDVNDLYVAQSEKDAAVLSYVQALRGFWAAHYRLRRLTLYDFAARRPLSFDR